MTPTRIPARRLVAVLLLSLVAVLAPVAGPATATADPVPASVGHDSGPVAGGPQTALATRSAPGGPLVPDDGPAGHPGPQLDALLLPPGNGPAPAVAERRGPADPDERGFGNAGDPRGPPRV